MADPTHPNRQDGRRRILGAVALARVRLRSSAGGRAARLMGGMVAAGFAVVAVVLRVSDGAEAQLSGLVITAAHWIAWIAGAPLAFAAAEDRRAIDRAEGIDALAAARGVSAAGLESARLLAAMAEIARAIGLPLVLLAALTAGVADRSSVALHRAGLAAGAAAFAIIAGVTLGGFGAACGRIGRERGRWLLFAVIAGPWVLADLAGHGAWSIPGALGAALDFALGLRTSVAATPLLGSAGA
jgi:hypothetical protein